MSKGNKGSERFVIIGAAAALGIFLVFTAVAPNLTIRPPAGFAAGKSATVRITLVTADAFDLGCAADFTVAGGRCAFGKDGKPSAPPQPEDGGILVPYMTLDNVLLLIPDLWKEPALAERLNEEDPQGKARSALKRFNATCRLEIDRRVKDFFVRWLPTAAWSPQPSAWAGRISNCVIE